MEAHNVSYLVKMKAFFRNMDKNLHMRESCEVERGDKGRGLF